MISIKEHVARHRQSLRAVTLLGVLLLCVAVARMLVNYKSTGANEGAAILAEIRQKGLQAYLPPAKCEDYYLITDKGRPLGWKVVYTQPEENGAFSGGCVMVRNTTPDAIEISVSQWELSKNATAGKYVSQVFLKDALPQEIDTTEIALNNKTVKLNQARGGISMDSASPMPANYIPEDLTQIAMFQLARNKKDACFKTILDAIPAENSYIPFITLKCRYDGSEGGLSKLAVRSSLDDSSMEDSIFCFDRAGKIVKVTYQDDTVESLSDIKTLKKTFPNSMNVIKMLTRKEEPESEK